MTPQQYTILAEVDLDEWPFEDSPEGVEKAQRLAPDDSEWVRFYADAPAYVLLEHGADAPDCQGVPAPPETLTSGSDPLSGVPDTVGVNRT